MKDQFESFLDFAVGNRGKNLKSWHDEDDWDEDGLEDEPEF